MSAMAQAKAMPHFLNLPLPVRARKIENPQDLDESTFARSKLPSPPRAWHGARTAQVTRDVNYCAPAVLNRDGACRCNLSFENAQALGGHRKLSSAHHARVLQLTGEEKEAYSSQT